MTLDLVALVPGKDDRETLAGLLGMRTPDLGLRAVRFEILVHPRRDPGCLLEAAATLRPFCRRAARGLVLFDHEGCGREAQLPEDLARQVKDQLAANGWEDRADAVVVAPELEVWVWSDSPLVDQAIGWRGPALAGWLATRGFRFVGSKPERPKEALEAALREAGRRRSSALFRQLAERLPLQGCRDPSFRRLVALLRSWFAAEQ